MDALGGTRDPGIRPGHLPAHTRTARTGGRSDGRTVARHTERDDSSTDGDLLAAGTATERGIDAPDGTRTRRHALPAVLRAPVEARTWRELFHLLIGLPVGVALWTCAVTMVSLSAGLLVTFAGVPLLALTLAGARAFGHLERARARALLALRVDPPAPVRPRRGGALAWTGAVLRSGASWRHLLYALVQMPWAVFAFGVAVTFWATGWALLTCPLWRWLLPPDGPGGRGTALYADSAGHTVLLDTPTGIAVACAVGLVLVVALPWLTHGLTAVDRLLVAGLLGPSPLDSRVSELESDRGVAAGTAAADLRRIERDLHDGAQARLTALAVDLGMAKETLEADPEAAARMVEAAHGEVKTALQELRDLARGIHPAVLTDRGLDAALSSLAARGTVPVAVEVDLASRPAAALEGIAYFAVSELLRNVGRHAGARHARVEVWRAGDRLLLQVADDGGGGAAASAGGGLAGLAERLGAVDGTLLVDSPRGGPTVVTAELPWRD